MAPSRARRWNAPRLRRASLSENILANPGHQDITAHVNFFRRAPGRGGSPACATKAWFRQSKFLTEIFQRVLAEAPDSGEWTASRVRQFQTLTHPEHLGHRFRALSSPGETAIPPIPHLIPLCA